MSIAILPTPPPTNNEWTQQVVRSNVKQAPFVLHDHSGGLYLLGNAYDWLKVAEVDFKNSAHLANDAPNDGPIHIVAHVKNRANFLAGFFKPPAAGEEADSRPRIVLQVGRPESVADDSLASSDIVWLSMKCREAYKKVADWLPQFLDLSFEDAVKIANAPDRGAFDPEFQRKYAQLLDITHPSDPTAVLAFRLLCEAANVVEEENSKRVAKREPKSNTADFSGITIHAPKDLGEWLAPFAPDGMDDPAKIASVVSKMGDADKTKVKRVLDVIKDNGDPKEHVLAFLGLTQTSTAQPQGGAQ